MRRPFRQGDVPIFEASPSLEILIRPPWYFVRRRIGLLLLSLCLTATGVGSVSATTYVFRALLPGGTASSTCNAGSFTEETTGTYSVLIPANCAATIDLGGAGGGGALGLGGMEPL